MDLLSTKAISAKLITPEGDRLLRVAINPAWVPSDRQAKELVKLRGRLELEGLR